MTGQLICEHLQGDKKNLVFQKAVCHAIRPKHI